MAGLAWTVASGLKLYHASSDSYEIRVYSQEGALERIIRRPIPNASVTGRDKELYLEQFVEGEGEFSAWTRRRVSELEFPATKPAYGTIKVDVLGNVWVAEYETPKEARTVKWTVFDAEGKMLGFVEVPRRGRISEIGDDYLIGLWRTELDVEQVMVYRLFRN